jgi:hypothetical protein
MRPDIYPRTLENIKAVLLYYFPNEKHSKIDSFGEEIYDNRKIELNVLEYLCQIISENRQFFEELYPHNGGLLSVNNVYMALFDDESSWNMSDNGKSALRKIKDQLG